MSQLDFEIIGGVDEIEMPVEVALVLGNRSQELKFIAVWKRDDVEEARAIFADISEKETELVGAEFVRYQKSFVNDRLLRIVGLPTKAGKRINAGGENDSYQLADVTEQICRMTEYLTGLYRSGVGSLLGVNIETARRKN